MSFTAPHPRSSRNLAPLLAASLSLAVPAAAAPSPSQNQQRVGPQTLQVSLEQLQFRVARFSIVNASKQKVAFIERGHTSPDRIDPYQVRALDVTGKELARLPRNQGTTYGLEGRRLVLVAPGGTFSTEVPILDGVKLEVTYRFDPRKLDPAPAAGSGQGSEAALRDRLFAGELKATLYRPWSADDWTGCPRQSGLSICRPIVRGGLDKGKIQELTRGRLAFLSRCARDFGRAQRPFGRHLMARYLITAQGTVVFGSAMIASAGLKACFAEEIGAWRFPACGCGGLVMVDQPFLLP
jgi:hypothetical protein